MSNVGFLLGLTVTATGVVWVGSRWVQGAADRLTDSYGRVRGRFPVPPIVQGALIAAVGSSMPELVSGLVATVLHGELELGVGGIVGSAVFGLLVIPGLAVLAGPGTLETDSDFVYTEALFHSWQVSFDTNSIIGGAR